MGQTKKAFLGWEFKQRRDRNGSPIKGVLTIVPQIGRVDKSLLEQSRQEEYGRIITPEEAEEGISHVPLIGEVGKRFLQAFNQYINPDKRVAIRYGDNSNALDYIIAKSRENEEIEITIRGGGTGYDRTGQLFMVPQPNLQILLLYGGNDLEFQPSIPKRPSGLFYKLRLKKAKELPLAEKFPLLARKYGATVYPSGKLEKPKIKVNINDQGLGGLANRLYKLCSEGTSCDGSPQ